MGPLGHSIKRKCRCKTKWNTWIPHPEGDRMFNSFFKEPVGTLPFHLMFDYLQWNLWNVIWNLWKEPNRHIFNATRLTHFEFAALALEDIKQRDLTDVTTGCIEKHLVYTGIRHASLPLANIGLASSKPKHRPTLPKWAYMRNISFLLVHEEPRGRRACRH